MTHLPLLPVLLMMQSVEYSTSGELLTAEQVESLLGVDKSTIYRMAADGRLAAIKVGRQWRFPATPIHNLLNIGTTNDLAEKSSKLVWARGSTPPAQSNIQPIIDLVADLLGVMMLVTDMDGRPISEVANPCPWFIEHGNDDSVRDACILEWNSLASDPDFEPHFSLGPNGFECARALIRQGNQLVGMVLAGGVSPHHSKNDGLHFLNAEARTAAVKALPKVAATLSCMTLPATQRVG